MLRDATNLSTKVTLTSTTIQMHVQVVLATQRGGLWRRRVCSASRMKLSRGRMLMKEVYYYLPGAVEIDERLAVEAAVSEIEMIKVEAWPRRMSLFSLKRYN